MLHFICKCDVRQRSYDDKTLKLLLFLLTIILISAEWSDISQQIRLLNQIKFDKVLVQNMMKGYFYSIAGVRAFVTSGLLLVMAESILSPKYFPSQIDLIVNFTALTVVLDLDKAV